MNSAIERFLRSRRNLIAGTACAFAFLRIWFFCAAFPLFDTLDEQDHLETVRNYAKGVSQGAALPISDPEMARVFALYGSPEYLIARQRLHSVGMDVPVPRLPSGVREAQFQKRFEYWRSQPVTEAQSPPVYYATAGVWFRLGAAFGLRDWGLAYWVRFLNAILYGAFVWVAFLFVREVYPRDEFLQVAVPGLLAVFPQDVFFGVNRDILSPLLVALALLSWARALAGSKEWRGELMTGSMIAGLAFLTDVSNSILYGAMGVVIFVLLRRRSREGLARFGLGWIAASVMCGLAPGILWMAKNRAVMGDLTASKAKMAYLGWTVKPWAEIWQHPIFSWRGAGYFLREVVWKYWRGELVWQGIPMRSAAMDGFYLISTMALLAAFLFHLAGLSAQDGAGFRGIESSRLFGWLALFLVAASVLFLAGISLPFDFHECVYPSRRNPYFLSGRIICGTLLPFALIYAIGFERLWRPLRKYVHPVVPFGVMCLTVVVAEVILRWDVVHSAFNFFALLQG